MTVVIIPIGLFKVTPVDELVICVSDNGIGIPDSIDLHDSKTFGLRLVSILAEGQLKGTLELAGNGGVKYSVIFNRRISEA